MTYAITPAHLLRGRPSTARMGRNGARRQKSALGLCGYYADIMRNPWRSKVEIKEITEDRRKTKKNKETQKRKEKQRKTNETK